MLVSKCHVPWDRWLVSGYSIIRQPTRCLSSIASTSAPHYSGNNATIRINEENCQPINSERRSGRQRKVVSIAEQRACFEALKPILGINRHEGWYNIAKNTAVQAGGKAIIDNIYGKSLAKALAAIYPEHEWHEWKFRHAPRNWWGSVANQRRYIDWLEKKTALKSLEDWYESPSERLLNNYGTSLLLYYGGSPLRLLKVIYPNHQWVPWRFPRVDMGFWTDTKTHRPYLEWILKELGLSHSAEDMLKVTTEQLRDRRGAGLLTQYDSLERAFRDTFPELIWPSSSLDGSKGQPRQKVFDVASQRIIFDAMKPALGINKPDDWYSITNVQAVKAGGSTIIRKHYHGSLIRALATIYPDHEWQAWRFRNVSGRWWEDLDNQRRYLRWFEAQEGIRTQTDWYTVPADKLRAKHGARLLDRYQHSPFLMLQTIYPNHDWDPAQFSLESWKIL